MDTPRTITARPSTSSQIGLAMILAGAAMVGAVASRQAGPSVAIRRAFAAWRTGEGSIYDLMGVDAEVAIPGTAAHCGVYRKDVFLAEVAAPFVARFTEPPVPHLRALWTNAAGIVVAADATGITRDGQSYANSYVFVFELKGSRVTRVTEFLDMAAFNAVWDRVQPAPADGEVL